MTATNYFPDVVIPDTVLMAPVEQYLYQLTLGNSVVQAIYAVAQLDIAGLLAAGPRHCDDLTQITGTFSGPLYRVLRFLTRFGIFKEIDSRCFALTQDNHPNSFRNYILFRGAESYAAVGELIHTLTTEESAFQKIYGMNRPEYLKQNPDRAKLFSAGMAVGSELLDQILVTAYDFSDIQILVNIGNVDRNHLVAILNHYPNLKIIFREESHTVENTSARFAQAGLLERCEFVITDTIESVVARADACLISAIHRLNDPDAINIIRACRQSLPHDGRLLIIEKIVSEQLPWFFLENDLMMLVSTSNGRLRTLDEFVAILTAGGFRLSRFVPIDAAIGLIESRLE